MKFSELDGKRIALWGLGRETRAFQIELNRYLPAAQIVAVVDDDTPERESREALAVADVMVRSPGVSIYKPLIQEARAAGKTVTTATSLWMAEREGRRVIGVTGTKGKSTTATVIAHLMRATGIPVELAGNIGVPVIELLDLNRDTWVVCELSSYQIADLTVGPEVAVLTNLSREHTDWHGSEQQYRADKLRIFGLPGVRAAVRPPEERGGWPLVVSPELIPLRGRHNAENVATAVAALRAAGLPLPPLPEALAGLRALPHRLQTVRVDGRGVEWVDDSISTTPGSTLAALEAFAERPLVLIAGGGEREQDYELLGAALAEREADTHLIVLPVTGDRIATAAAGHGLGDDRILAMGGIGEAVASATGLALPDGVVLLSPAAPSFNQYRNFEERGDDFAACAKSVDLAP